MDNDRYSRAERDGRMWRAGSPSALLEDGRLGQASAPRDHPMLVRRVAGESSILARLEQLQALAEQCGQAGEMDQLAYYLSAARIRAKAPHLLLFETPQRQLTAAVLMSEYIAGFLPTRLFFSLDFTGQRTVIAPPHLRTTIALTAATHLLKRGALLSLVSVAGQSFAGDPALPRGFRSGALDRPIQQLWRLGKDFDDTLAGMGKHTRRNFRLYLRTLEANCGAAYVPDAETTTQEFLRLNRHSTHPTTEAIARWRFRAVKSFAGSRLAGIRSSDGHWLSLVGLRTRNGLTDLDWQMNLTDIKGVSLVTALRAYLLCDELDRGTRFLRFDGGTSHAMQASFEEQPVSHLLLTHRSISPGFLRGLVTRIFAPDNLLLNVICSPELRWSEGRQQS